MKYIKGFSEFSNSSIVTKDYVDRMVIIDHVDMIVKSTSSSTQTFSPEFLKKILGFGENTIERRKRIINEI